MRGSQPSAAASWPPRWLKWPVILLSLVGVAALLWQALPRAGNPTDLSRIDFPLADLALPEAQAYASRHGARQGTVLLFAAGG